MLKMASKILFLMTFVLILTKSWFSYTSGFRMDKIKPIDFENSDFIKCGDVNLDSILNQDFHFLSKGRHTFVFKSTDDKHVIKFFRFHRYKMPVFFQIFQSISFIGKYKEKLRKELDESYAETMKSYQLAYTKLANETAAIFIHLPGNGGYLKTIFIVDKFKVKRMLYLDDYGFIIQRKAKSFSKELFRIKNDEKAVEDLLISFFSNLDSIYKKNIINNDRHVLNNLGVIEGKVIEMDTGRFCLNPEIAKKDILEKEAKNYIVYLKKWLSKNIPRALPVLDRQLSKLINSETDG